MPLFALNSEFVFPPVELAEPNGLLAIGGDLRTERLVLAYQQGIFPWYSKKPILWWCPDPRFVLFPSDLRVSGSMKKFLKRNTFTFHINKDFRQVIHSCKTIYRPDQEGTWITDEVEKAFIKLYEAGYAHSAEAWENGALVGGMYGIKLGKLFFGESMFSLVTNASKFALIQFVQWMKKNDMELLDCQVYTEHLESLGATMIPRKEFINILNRFAPVP